MTPVLSFDQPMYIKAMSITHSESAGEELKSIVLRLGCFHLQMSFLGTICNIITDSGLKEALQLVFTPNAVIHMLSGKAYDRAVRGHLLVDAALNALFTANSFNFPAPLIHHQYTDRAEEQGELLAPVHESAVEGSDEGDEILLQPVHSGH